MLPTNPNVSSIALPTSRDTNISRIFRTSATIRSWLVVFVVVFATLLGGLRGRLRCAALLVDFARAVGAHSAKTAHALELSSD